MRAWAEAAALEVLGRVGVSDRGPVDVVGVARRLGVDAIVASDMGSDGHLRTDASGEVILVQRAASFGRRRFTIAHEIGHIYIRQCEGHRRLTAADEERFCDAFAEALLMPREWILDVADAELENLQTLRWLSELAGVSLAAALVRLRRILRWRRSLLRWRVHNGQWKLHAAVSLPTRISGVHATRETQEILWTLHGARVRESSGWLPIGVGRNQHRVHAQLALGRGNAMVFADLGTARPNESPADWLADLHARIQARSSLLNAAAALEESRLGRPPEDDSTGRQLP